MGNLLRRREMILSGGGLPEWDYEWDYTMGLPSGDMTRYSNLSTVYESLVSDGLRMETTGNGAILRYQNGTTLMASTGVIEAKMKFACRSSNYGGWVFIRFSNGTNGIAICFVQLSTAVAGQKIVLWDTTSALSYATQIGSFVSNRYYVVRCVLKGEFADVYIDGNLVAENVDASTIAYTTTTNFGVQGLKERTHHYGQFEYVKIKAGRI